MLPLIEERERFRERRALAESTRKSLNGYGLGRVVDEGMPYQA